MIDLIVAVLLLGGIAAAVAVSTLGRGVLTLRNAFAVALVVALYAVPIAIFVERGSDLFPRASRNAVSLLGIAVGFATFILQREVQAWGERSAARRSEDNLIRMLYAEIDFNIRDLERFRRASPDLDSLRTAFEADTALVPHVTDARHTIIYRSRMEDIHHVSDAVMHRMVDFYGTLERITAQVHGIHRDPFRTISIEGKLTVFKRLKGEAEKAVALGQGLLASFEHSHPRLSLTRHHPGPGGERSDDDRVGTGHGKPPAGRNMAPRTPKIK